MTHEPYDFAFLHGGGQGSWVWSPTIAALKEQASDDSVRIMALDIPGCGAKRGRAIEHLERHDVSRELVADLESAGMKNVVMVGHSLAGNVLPALAELRPELFRRLVYVSCSIPLQGQTVLQMMGSGSQGSRDDEVGWPAESTTALRDRNNAMFCEEMDESQKASFLADLEQDEWPHSFFSATDFTFEHMGSVPSTYVVCLRDRILPVAWQEKFAKRFHAERLVRIDAGHQVMVTRPHALAEVLRCEALRSATE